MVKLWNHQRRSRQFLSTDSCIYLNGRPCQRSFDHTHAQYDWANILLSFFPSLYRGRSLAVPEGLLLSVTDSRIPAVVIGLFLTVSSFVCSARVSVGLVVGCHFSSEYEIDRQLNRLSLVAMDCGMSQVQSWYRPPQPLAVLSLIT